MAEVKQLQLNMPTSGVVEVTACAFTGHRVLTSEFSAQKTQTVIEELIARGVCTFYNGMAVGFDLETAKIVVKLKAKYPQIRFVACIPFYGQEKRFSEAEKKLYAELLASADEQVVLFPSYVNGCFLARDRYMADRADVLVAFCKSETGGTAYTVRYFRRKKPHNEVLFV